METRKNNASKRPMNIPENQMKVMLITLMMPIARKVHQYPKMARNSWTMKNMRRMRGNYMATMMGTMLLLYQR